MMKAAHIGVTGTMDIGTMRNWMQPMVTPFGPSLAKPWNPDAKLDMIDWIFSLFVEFLLPFHNTE